MKGRDYSRLLNVHAWSEHKAISGLVDQIFAALPPDQQRLIKGRSNNRGRADLVKHLRVALVDLYVGWKIDPELYTAVSRNRNGYLVGTRYNALHISPRITKVYDALVADGLLEVIAGAYNKSTPSLSRMTRYRPTKKLQSLFEQVGLETCQLSLHHDQECIIMREKDGDDRRQNQTYQDTNLTISMRVEVQAYNDLMTRHYVDLSNLKVPVIERVRKVKGRSELQQIAIDQGHKFTRRVFSRNNWEMNGWWYGGFWQNLPNAERRHIQIDGEPTDEIDYSGLHPALLALQNGVRLTSDPYDLGYQVTRSIPLSEQRMVVKLLVLVAINAKNMDAAIRAFQKGNFGYKKKDLIEVMEAFKSKHPYLADSLCADRGIHLMYIDSQITAHIINEFVALGKPILPIHDSYIVKIDDRDLLRSAMRRASLAVIGADLEAVSKFDESMGFATLDGKANELQAEIATDELNYRQYEGCEEYLERYKAWFEIMHPGEEFLPFQIGAIMAPETSSSQF